MLYLSLFEAHSSPPKPYGYRWGVLLHNYEEGKEETYKNQPGKPATSVVG